jgi:hypothetical protein
VAGSVPFAWIVADEVYGRAGQLRAYVESLDKGYVFTVPTSFAVTCADGVHTVTTLARRVPTGGWSQRSCGPGCKGHRWYEWAWIATASPTHQVLVRRHPGDHSKVTFFYCHTPHGATLATLVRIAGRRWPVETCFQAAKSILGIDAHQVRLWHSWHRHTVLTLLAAAVLAVATADPDSNAPADRDPGDGDRDSDRDGGNTDTVAATTVEREALPAQPASWRDTAPLPVRPDQPPPADHGMIKVSIAESRRLLAIATSAATTTVKLFYLHCPTGDDATKPAPLASLAHPPTRTRDRLNPHQPSANGYVTNPDCSTLRESSAGKATTASVVLSQDPDLRVAVSPTPHPVEITRAVGAASRTMTHGVTGFALRAGYQPEGLFGLTLQRPSRARYNACAAGGSAASRRR